MNSQPVAKRPFGLTIFAVINFVSAALIILACLVIDTQEQAGITICFRNIVEPPIIIALLVISGIGFLRLGYIAGYICGIAYCVLSLLSNLSYLFIGLHVFLTFATQMIYPIVLILMLTLRYRKSFVTEVINPNNKPAPTKPTQGDNEEKRSE